MTRVKIGIIARALLFLVIFELLIMGLQSIPLGLPRWTHGIVIGGGFTVVMLFVTHLFLKSDSLTRTELGLNFAAGSLRRFFLSLGAGMALFGCFFLVYLWLTPVRVVGVSELNILDAVVVSFFAILMLAVMEEVVFRGYPLKKLESAVGIRAAIYVTSIFFGLYHGLTIDSLTGPAVWGLLYGTLAYWSKGLAVPIGFHAGVNLTQALFSQKEKWASGFWTFETTDELTTFTVDQVTMGLQLLLLIAGVAMVELYLRKRPHGPRHSA